EWNCDELPRAPQFAAERRNEDCGSRGHATITYAQARTPTRTKSSGRDCLAVVHHPGNGGFEGDDVFEDVTGREWQSDQVSEGPHLDTAQSIMLSQSSSAVDRCHFEGVPRCERGVFAKQLAHFRKQTQVGIAREAVSPKADVEAVRTQPFERKGRVTKETVTARAMR